MTVRAIYDKGVFRPREPVELPEPCEVEFEPRVVEPRDKADALKRVREILSHRYDSGETDVAERHNEHQP
jgi:predicted DNA-binding antitoxin AbrB/MazE fold protein